MREAGWEGAQVWEPGSQGGHETAWWRARLLELSEAEGSAGGFSRPRDAELLTEPFGLENTPPSLCVSNIFPPSS